MDLQWSQMQGIVLQDLLYRGMKKHALIDKLHVAHRLY